MLSKYQMNASWAKLSRRVEDLEAQEKPDKKALGEARAKLAAVERSIDEVAASTELPEPAKKRISELDHREVELAKREVKVREREAKVLAREAEEVL